MDTAENRRPHREHLFLCTLRWTGAAAGPTTSYAGYSRELVVDFADRPPLRLSAAPAFLGDGALHNPEDLLVAALSACHCLSFLALAARAGLLCEAYEDRAEGTLGVVQKGLRFTEVRLRPRVTLRRPAAMDGDALTAQVAELHEKAHAQCFIASSVNFPVRHQAELILSS